MTSPNEEWLQRVRYTAAEPTAWLGHARTLRQAAEDLWKAGNAHDSNPGSEIGATVLVNWSDPNFVRPETGGSTYDVCIMVLGFALENLTKGIIVCRSPTLVTKGKLKRWHGKGHDLVALFNQARIGMDERERQTLERTSRMSELKGRYPVAMNFYEVDVQDLIIGHVAVSNIWPADEYARLCKLYDSTKALFIETMEAVSPLPADYQFE